MAINGIPHPVASTRVSDRRAIRPVSSHPNCCEALRELLAAYRYAHQTERDLWEFAVSIDELRLAGLRETDFRWLVCEGVVGHAREVTRSDDLHRHFRASNPMMFSKRTCFILTEHGYEWAESLFGDDSYPTPRASVSIASVEHVSHAHPSDHRPCWDADRHELRWNGLIVKQFKWPALNQESILAAFQEESWPVHIDDPLPPQPEQDPKRRLSDTIKCLNRKQQNPLIHFRGDGTGEGVIWELVERKLER